MTQPELQNLKIRPSEALPINASVPKANYFGQQWSEAENWISPNGNA